MWPAQDRQHRAADVHRVLWPGVLLLASGVVLGYVLTAIGARKTGELRLDVWITHHRPEWLRVVAMVINDDLRSIVAIIGLVVLVVVLLVGGRGRTVVAEISIFATAMWSVQLIKHAYHRVRPPDPPVDRIAWGLDPHSMPSGHTAAATAIVCTACVTAWYARGKLRMVLLPGVPFVLLVAFSRLVVGAHYLGDVVVAMLVSVGSTLLVVAALVHLDKLGPAVKGRGVLSPPADRMVA